MAEDKKPKRKRRNFEEILKSIEQYCSLSIEIITANDPTAGPNDNATFFGNGKIAAFREILNKIGGGAK